MTSLIEEVIKSYPEQAQSMLLNLRDLISLAAAEANIGPVEESIKWGEPSFHVKGGSAVRLSWNPKHPNQCLILFHCQTSLIETFKEIYGDTFYYEGKRAIIFPLYKDIPMQELKHCVSLAHQYHKLKHLPLLGA